MNAPHALPQFTADPLIAGLNDRQLEAVIQPDVSSIILAGAGSGKTKVLTTRIAWLIRGGRAAPETVMAVTFTNKAAKEMKDRLAKLIDSSVKDMYIGTFHGLCHRMLRENAQLAGLPPSFAILDDDDQLAMVKRIIKDEAVVMPEGVDAKKIQGYINKMKEKGVRAGRCDPSSDLEIFAASFYGSYESRCTREGVVDFAELMLRVYELFNNSPEFLAKYQGRFSHLHVDEFQDTNTMQYEWLRAIQGDRAVIFAVGDDDQSIYSFRGSNPENMTQFTAEVGEGRIIRLEQNYRSTGSILAAANSLIEKNEGRLGKNLWTDAGEGKKMSVIEFANDLDEADRVATLIKTKLSSGADPSQIAILYRSNYQSRAYERALVTRSIPYVIYGGTRFFERMEVKNVLAYMRLTVNLEDDGAFSRVINIPPRGIGETAAAEIVRTAREFEPPKALFETAATLIEGRLKERTEAFSKVIFGLFDAVNSQPLPEFIKTVITTTGLVDMYSKKEEDKERLANIQEMVTAAQHYCEESDDPEASTRPAIEMIDAFLANASLDSDLGKNEDSTSVNTKKDFKAVTLMTVHAAKGLEFDSVFIGGAEDGVFPVDRALDEGNLDEERRLMYVAITRARKDVTATWATNRRIYGVSKELVESRFISEIADDHKVVTKVANSRPQYGQQNGSGQKAPFKKWKPS